MFVGFQGLIAVGANRVEIELSILIDTVSEREQSDNEKPAAETESPVEHENKHAEARRQNPDVEQQDERPERSQEVFRGVRRTEKPFIGWCDVGDVGTEIRLLFFGFDVRNLQPEIRLVGLMLLAVVGKHGYRFGWYAQKRFDTEGVRSDLVGERNAVARFDPCERVSNIIEDDVSGSLIGFDRLDCIEFSFVVGTTISFVVGA